MPKDIRGAEIQVGDYFVASRPSGNVHGLRFGYIVALEPAIKARTWMSGIGTLRQHDSILVVPVSLVRESQLQWLLEQRLKDLARAEE